jgi:hypothetical protein
MNIYSMSNSPNGTTEVHSGDTALKMYVEVVS